MAVQIEKLNKTFNGSGRVLSGISLNVARGEMVALIGASGSGKSTLIRAISGLMPVDRDSGRIAIFGEDIQRRGRIQGNARDLRARIGVIFQQFNLVPRLALLTNVLLGALGRTPRLRGSLGLFSKAEKRRAMDALDRVGIARYALQRGSTLSGGQQQRAAIARSLVQGAELLIADEPIASLDPASARKVMDIIAELNRSEDITVIVSLHQVEYAIRYCPRTIALRDGELVYDGPSEALTPEFLNELYGHESEELFLPGLQDRRDDEDDLPAMPAAVLEDYERRRAAAAKAALSAMAN